MKRVLVPFDGISAKTTPIKKRISYDIGADLSSLPPGQLRAVDAHANSYALPAGPGSIGKGEGEVTGA